MELTELEKAQQDLIQAIKLFNKIREDVYLVLNRAYRLDDYISSLAKEGKLNKNTSLQIREQVKMIRYGVERIKDNSSIRELEAI